MTQAPGNGELVIIWRYRVSDEHTEAFVRAYGPDGDWARLFRVATGFLGTEFLRGEAAGDYATIDRWASRSDWEAFMAEHAADYNRLDVQFAPLTDIEELVFHGSTTATEAAPGTSAQ